MRFLWASAALAWVALIHALSSVSGGDLPPLFPGADKGVHVCLYGVLAALVWRSAARPDRCTHWVYALGVVIGCAAYGVIDEWHQSFVANRTPSLSDWVADLSGAGAVVWILRRRALAYSPVLVPGSVPRAKRFHTHGEP